MRERFTADTEFMNEGYTDDDDMNEYFNEKEKANDRVKAQVQPPQKNDRVKAQVQPPQTNDRVKLQVQPPQTNDRVKAQVQPYITLVVNVEDTTWDGLDGSKTGGNPGFAFYQDGNPAEFTNTIKSCKVFRIDSGVWLTVVNHWSKAHYNKDVIAMIPINPDPPIANFKSYSKHTFEFKM